MICEYCKIHCVYIWRKREQRIQKKNNVIVFTQEFGTACSAARRTKVYIAPDDPFAENASLEYIIAFDLWLK